MWILSALFSAIFSYSWDVKQDWGLLSNKEYLRSPLYYPKAVRLPSVCSNLSVLLLGFSHKRYLPSVLDANYLPFLYDERVGLLLAANRGCSSRGI
jgi:hypothetical protein